MAPALRPDPETLSADGDGTTSIGGVVVPHAADWAFRPAAWSAPQSHAEFAGIRSGTEIAPGIKLFHDHPEDAVTLRQSPTGTEGPASCTLALAIETAGARFASLAVDLPEGACSGLERDFLVVCGLAIEGPDGTRAFARLNLRHGPNTEQMTQALAVPGVPCAEFDLFHSDVDTDAVSAAWIDVIVADPVPGTYVIGDFTAFRRRRGQF